MRLCASARYCKYVLNPLSRIVETFWFSVYNVARRALGALGQNFAVALKLLVKKLTAVCSGLAKCGGGSGEWYWCCVERGWL